MMRAAMRKLSKKRKRFKQGSDNQACHKQKKKKQQKGIIDYINS